jgi:putative PIN family toxin of toxin-antitoxin system
MRRIVIDTNVLVSSLLVRAGLPARVLDGWRQRRYLLVTSPALIAEVRAVLKYPRIRNKYAITDEDVEGLVALLEEEAVVVPGEVEVENVIPEDPADERVLACAVEAGADGIVSGDRHLLDLGGYRGIRILTVREFLEELEGYGPGGERG